MNHVFLVPKDFDSWSIKCHFRSICGSFPVKKFSKYFYIPPKHSSLNFRGSLLNYFRAIVFISVVISVSEDFDRLLPARAVTVKLLFESVTLL